jgi:hypothetical protein
MLAKKIFHTFLSTFGHLGTFIFELFRLIVPGDQVLEYKLCTGYDPNAVILLPPFGRGYVEIVKNHFDNLIH